jgi:DNA uptake protein ComE-like DNA-binding protein
MLKKLSEKIGFTKTEIRVTIFLFITFAAGFSYKNFFRDNGLSSYRNFDYSRVDSAFFSSGVEKDSADNIQSDGNKDYILELNKNDIKKIPAKIIASKKSIDLNNADIQVLTTLPNVGMKTAERIIELRTKLGRFNNFNELLSVKNIGAKRLAIIKKYAYIK